MSRGVSPVIGVVILLLLTVTLAGSVGMAVSMEPPSQPPTAQLSATVTDDTVTLTHEYGEPLDIMEIEIAVAVNDTPLEYQPPVPFFSTTGFHGGPTGPFNTESSNIWRVGQSAAFSVAQTNSPQISADADVTITVRTEDIVLFEETVRPE